MVFAEICVAQSDSIGSRVSQDATLFSIATNDGWVALKDAGYVWVAPADWETRDWLLAGGVVVVTALSSAADNKAANPMERNQSPFNDDATNVAVEYGSGAVRDGDGRRCVAHVYTRSLALGHRVHSGVHQRCDEKPAETTRSLNIAPTPNGISVVWRW